MADAKGPSLNPIDDLKSVVFLIVVLWLFWVYAGGPAKYEVSQKAFLRPSWPIDTVTSYGEISDITDKVNIKSGSVAQDVKIESPAGDVVPARDVPIVAPQALLPPQNVSLKKGGTDGSGRSYIILDFPPSNSRPLNLASATLRGLFGAGVAISRAANLPYQGKINQQTDIVMPAGSRALIIDGESPICVSFRVNNCFGYLTQFQEYLPPISVNCPECQTDRPEDQDYNSCVRARQNNPDFFTNEWRIYYKNSGMGWNETGDIIRLFDKDGKSISSLIY